MPLVVVDTREAHEQGTRQYAACGYGQGQIPRPASAPMNDARHQLLRGSSFANRLAAECDLFA